MKLIPWWTARLIWSRKELLQLDANAIAFGIARRQKVIRLPFGLSIECSAECFPADQSHSDQ